jgi:hypothetical protein
MRALALRATRPMDLRAARTRPARRRCDSPGAAERSAYPIRTAVTLRVDHRATALVAVADDFADRVHRCPVDRELHQPQVTTTAA